MLGWGGNTESAVPFLESPNDRRHRRGNEYAHDLGGVDMRPSQPVGRMPYSSFGAEPETTPSFALCVAANGERQQRKPRPSPRPRGRAGRTGSWGTGHGAPPAPEELAPSWSKAQPSVAY